MYTDTVYQINLVPFIREHLQNAMQATGRKSRFNEEWLSAVDKDVLKGFMDLGVM